MEPIECELITRRPKRRRAESRYNASTPSKIIEELVIYTEAATVGRTRKPSRKKAGRRNPRLGNLGGFRYAPDLCPIKKLHIPPNFPLSPASGLLGLKENEYVSSFLDGIGCLMLFISRSQVRELIVTHMMRDGGFSPKVSFKRYS